MSGTHPSLKLQMVEPVRQHESENPGNPCRFLAHGNYEVLGICCFKLLFCFVCLFLAVLGFCGHSQTFSSYREWRLLFIVVHEPLMPVASLVAEHGL